MINATYTGNLGNVLFQYCFARLTAEHNKFNFNGSFSSDAIKTTPPKTFQEGPKTRTVTIDDNTYHNYRQTRESKVMRLNPEYNYVFHGYFQDADFFNKYRDEIRSFFILPDVVKNEKDTLVLFRLGDFIHNGWNSEIIHYDWYNEAMQNMPGEKKLVISSNLMEMGKSTKEHEQKYIAKLNHPTRSYEVPKGGAEDFNYIRSFDNIISSNSTWSWWACYLSDAKNIITHSHFGHFTPGIKKSHGVHVKNLWNINNISKPIQGDFINILEL